MMYQQEVQPCSLYPEAPSSGVHERETSTSQSLRSKASSIDITTKDVHTGALDGPPCSETPSSLDNIEGLSLMNALDGTISGASPLAAPVGEDILFKRMIQLTPEDHAAVCRAIGGMSLDESHQVLYTKSAIWPPKGLPDGLYKDVISARFLSQIRYHACSLLFNVLLVSQLVIGAIITALSAGDKAGTAITVIAACNTVVAGMLALVNGSGAPDRYKNDAIEFEKVEKFMEEIMYGGIVKEGITKEHVIAECFDQYSKARATQASNKPGTYTATAADKGGMTTVGK